MENAAFQSSTVSSPAPASQHSKFLRKMDSTGIVDMQTEPAGYIPSAQSTRSTTKRSLSSSTSCTEHHDGKDGPAVTLHGRRKMTRVALVVSTPWGSNRQETVFQPPPPSPMSSLSREAVNTAPVVQQPVGKHITGIHVANSFSLEDSPPPTAGTRGQENGGTPLGVQEELSAFTGGGMGSGGGGGVPVGNAASDGGVAASRPDTDRCSRDAMELDTRSPAVGSSVDVVDDLAGLACERERFRGGGRDGRFSQGFEWRRRG